MEAPKISQHPPAAIHHFLSRNKHALEWGHIVLTFCLIVVSPILYLNGILGAFWGLFLFPLIGFCQNIGLMHHLDHLLPRGPKGLGLALAELMHSLGGLNFASTKITHFFHHKYLGTEQDPDRNGYNHMTLTFLQRVRYLFFIGPIRARFAPVDISGHLATWSAPRLQEHQRKVRRSHFARFGVHLVLLGILGVSYFIWFGALLTANVLSNVREMVEHGNGGTAGLVNIRPSLVGLTFFSTPGFWYHGIHHRNPHIHYLELGMAAPDLIREGRFTYLSRNGYLKYMLFGN